MAFCSPTRQPGRALDADSPLRGTCTRNALTKPTTVAVSLVFVLIFAQSLWSETSRRRDRAGLPDFAGEAKAILGSLDEQSDFVKAKRDADALFDRLILATTPRQKKPFTEVALTRRLVQLLAHAPPDSREALRAFLERQPRIASELAFAVKPEDRPGRAMSLFHQLVESRKSAVIQFPALAIAVCLVHDEPLERRIIENTVKAPDAIRVFDYFVTNSEDLLFNPRGVPPELLMWVVDTTSSVSEMEWALNKFPAKNTVGHWYFKVKYDSEHFFRGVPKRVSQHGYTLPNLLSFGGVCADQAYFAMSVGKAFGVPTAFAKAEGGQVFHAWVGFVQSSASGSTWNFNAGRYRAYKGLKGNVIDPQTRKPIPDSYVSLTAGLMGVSAGRRHEAVALADAGERRGDMRPLQPAQSDKQERDSQAPLSTTEHQLALINAALELNHRDARLWFLVGDLAEKGNLNLEMKRFYASRLTRSFGKRYPDFLLAIYRRMVSSVDDPAKQDRLWQELYAMFEHRRDLAAEVLMARARMWDQHGETARAGKSYQKIVELYANDGPFVIEALERTEEMLTKSGLAKRAVALYRQSWERMEAPGNFARQFRKKTNWYRVAVLYKGKLEEAGLSKAATTVQERIDKELND